jgi:hypothetical protein
VHRHGFVEDRVYWILDPDRYAQNPTHAGRSKADIHSRLADCSRCGALRVGGEACRHCGFKPAPPPKYYPFKNEDLAMVRRDRSTVGHFVGPADRLQFHRQLAHIADERGYKPGWVGNTYKDKFGNFPPDRHVEPMPPSAETRSWVRSRMIAYARSRNRDEGPDDRPEGGRR